MIYPKINKSMKWKNGYIHIERKKNGTKKNNRRYSR